MIESSICTGKVSCTSLAIILALLFMAIFFNYIIRCLTSNPNPNPNPNPNSSLPTTAPPNTPSPEHHPLLRHILKSLPATPYTAAAPPPCDGGEGESCPVCLAEFENGENVRVLPKCKHVYHVECIDKWLMRSLRCPVCRERVVDQQFVPKILMGSSSDHDHHNVVMRNYDHNNQPLPIANFVINIGTTHATAFL